jgi:hypothetical protein
MEQTKAEYMQSIFGTTDHLERAEMIHAENYNLDMDGTVKLALPYEAPDHPPLPTLEDIQEAIKTHSLMHPLGEFAVCRVGPCVVKFGECIRILQVRLWTPRR